MSELVVEFIDPLMDKIAVKASNMHPASPT